MGRVRVPAWEQTLPEPVKHRLWRLREVAGRRLREATIRDPRHETKVRREELAIHHLRGEGIEIGAMDWPLAVPPGVTVRYVDHAAPAELRDTYATELSMFGRELVVPDVVDEAETLLKFGAASVDFVIANHVLEHTEDPIAALQTFVRVVRRGGVIFLTLPDARFTFDAPRPRTTVEHLLVDHRDGPEASRRDHQRECAALIEGVPEEQLDARVAEMEAAHTRPHFHVWELETFLELLSALALPVRLACAQQVGDEFSVILRRK
jgi:predicted SAM-dependent methyltransferase